MRLIRTLLILALALLVPATVSAFWAHQSLANHDAYADRMADALADPQLQEEFATSVSAAAEEQIVAALGADPNSFLVNAALALVNNAVAEGIDSADFAAAWRDWQRGLHQDLAVIAEGGTPPTTEVTSDSLRVDVAPLVSALLGGGIGSLAGNLVGDSPIIQDIELTTDLDARLSWLNSLAQSRWLLLAGLMVALIATLALGRPTLRGAAWAFGGVALGCVGAGIAVATSTGATPTDSATPILTKAVSQAVTAGWAPWLFVAAAGSGALSLLLVVATRSRTAAAAHSA